MPNIIRISRGIEDVYKRQVQYITGLARAIMWYSNTFSGTAYDIDTDIKIDFNDSYIRDRCV